MLPLKWFVVDQLVMGKPSWSTAREEGKEAENDKDSTLSEKLGRCRGPMGK